MLKYIIGIAFFLATAPARSQPTPPYYNAENLRSDTFNILRYNIHLDIGASGNPAIKGYTEVKFVTLKNNQNFIRLDLLKLTIDSVKENNSLLTYNYNDTILKVNFLSPKSLNDTALISVFYHGQPQVDATGWGGFYFNNTQNAEYAFNLGVGFGADPHNYGRVWFPCFDNFVERSSYEFHITSDSSRLAYCNGALVSDVVNGANRTRVWKLDEEIPSYLASVTLADYSQVNWTANTLNGPRPVILAAHASDTSAMKNSFVNLLSCLSGYENYFGPYEWNRVGYCLVPFNSGAMEHAANITYPRNAIGSLAFEDLMAHELSHHWWGNLITCETPEDMWINEGLASFSAHLFFEWQYGKQKYLERVKNKHEDLLHFLHKQEGGFHAVSGVGHHMTYSSHVYNKGADVAHTLRGYMGDAAFFAACKYLMQQKAWNSINSNEMRDLLQTSSGQNLTDFFNDWIFNGGWSHFAIDSARYQPLAGNVIATVGIRQKLFGAPALHKNVPLELSFFNSDFSRSVQSCTMSGASATFTFNLPFQPVYCALNYDSKISDATSHEARYLKNNGNHNFVLGKATVQVTNTGSDSSLVRIVHNYVPPDPFKQNIQGHLLSDQRYWRVEGILSGGFEGKIRFVFDGTKGSSGSSTYLDTMLTRVNGDSIALFYRKDAGDDWHWLKNAFKVQNGVRTGFIETETIEIGEYTFANLGDTTISTSLRENLIKKEQVLIFPNPSTHQVTVALNFDGTSTFILYDVHGKKVFSKEISKGETVLELNNIPKGNYQAELRNNSQTVYTGKLILH